jgi:hypothetical protein
MRSSTPTADTRAAQAALARLPITDASIECCLVIDDTDEDATQIISLITERSLSAHNLALEVHS